MKLEQSEKLLITQLFESSRPETVISFIDRLTGDASTRRYYRLGSGNESYVVCLDNPISDDPENYSFYSIQKYLQRHGVRVPQIYDVQLDKGYLLEEDLGDETLLSRLGQASIDEEYQYYQDALSKIFQMQSIDINKEKNSFVLERSFDTERYMYEFNFTIDYFFKDFLGVELTTAERKILERDFHNISQFLADETMVFTHRDYHSRNLMIRNKEMIVIDFQDARQGNPLYDLVSLTEDCYFSLVAENRYRLITSFYDEQKKILKEKSREYFNRSYDLMTVQRVFKAIGSFCFIYKNRGDIRYLKYIGRAFENVRKVLGRYTEYRDTHDLMSRYYYDS